MIPADQIAQFRDTTPSVMALKLQELEVTQYWGVIFSPKGIATLIKQDMTGFLSYRQNKRWREISKDDVTADMDRLRQALLVLIDETRPLAERLDALEPMVAGRYTRAHLTFGAISPSVGAASPDYWKRNQFNTVDSLYTRGK
jgi:hypothetical protein